MKWDCGPSFEEKWRGAQRWRLWFAWYPVQVGPNDCRWLEWVEVFGLYCRKYRPRGSDGPGVENI